MTAMIKWVASPGADFYEHCITEENVWPVVVTMWNDSVL
jgi:hypothetical protein